ncbi:hypothetical protein, unlikely [Trypanosoma brucei gambiense DAL972]|uniref:Uncharacterized protein n=1 Tax=Trypanosoma brucei gambiense (strain MHOM/CI/86/DAL972) TaxID=679716 RepID=C9ZNA1_TRYB9|nr:hypothetical protein, unlikely [Trypanosoma brucei gambiense DAL972]CBH10879.1 hypothetical protein, unlikely [Trypanosoma brucei gambiense DAL972]|eukprot:XP_011773166.1 hypothetical protein, unlikely [Trypanosoma brucei gambiense DAL972]
MASSFLSCGWSTKFSCCSYAISPHLLAVIQDSLKATRSRSSVKVSHTRSSSQRNMGRTCFMVFPPVILHSPATNTFALVYALRLVMIVVSLCTVWRCSLPVANLQ